MATRYSGSLKLALTYLPDDHTYRVIVSWTDSPGSSSEKRRHKTVKVPVVWKLALLTGQDPRDLDLAAAIAIRSSPTLKAAAEVSPELGVHVRRQP